MNEPRKVASIETLSEYLGERGAQAIVQGFGGTSLKVPKRQAGAVWDDLVARLGAKIAGEFVDYFGGEGLYIPMGHVHEIDDRRVRVAKELAKGKSYRQIAQELTFTTRYTERGIRRIMERHRGKA